MTYVHISFCMYTPWLTVFQGSLHLPITSLVLNSVSVSEHQSVCFISCFPLSVFFLSLTLSLVCTLCCICVPVLLIAFPVIVLCVLVFCIVATCFHCILPQFSMFSLQFNCTFQEYSSAWLCNTRSLYSLELSHCSWHWFAIAHAISIRCAVWVETGLDLV